MPISVHKAFSSSNIFASLFMIHSLKQAFYGRGLFSLWLHTFNTFSVCFHKSLHLHSTHYFNSLSNVLNSCVSLFVSFPSIWSKLLVIQGLLFVDSSV